MIKKVKFTVLAAQATSEFQCTCESDSEFRACSRDLSGVLPCTRCSKWQDKPVNHANCTSVGLWVTEGDALYFFIKNKDWDAFWPLLKYTVFTCRFKWQKTHINNNKNSRTRGGKSGGVEDQPQPRRLWRSRTPNARSLSRPSSFPPSSHNLSFPRVHWCVMGRLVHRSPVSSYLIAQVLHPFPHANSFV